MTFSLDEIVMHATEGWYGIVESMPREGEEEVYRVQNLDATKSYRVADLTSVTREDQPSKYLDLTVVAHRVEKVQQPPDKLFDFIHDAILELDHLPQSARRTELTELLFKSKDIIDDLRHHLLV